MGLGQLADRVALEPAELRHVQRLVGEWSMLADFCFSDLVLYVPDRRRDGGVERYVMVDHVRPSTSQTVYQEVVVGQVRTPAQRPLIERAFTDGVIARGEIDSAWLGEKLRVDAIPVRCGERTVAVMAREFVSAFRNRPGELEQIYERVFERFATMIAAGRFPFPPSDAEHSNMPRVGDGVVVVDAAAEIVYSSPNATSILTRSGTDRVIRGSTLADLGFAAAGVRTCLGSGQPAVNEVGRPGDVTVAVRVLPFVEQGAVTGAVALLRDISDLRRRDRLLLSKDATISEIHHRVKNNLQTISSLLRLESRRLVEPSARAAVDEAVRRIHSIALVHETLSREPSDDVEFREILVPLVRMVSDGLVSDEHPIRFQIDGEAGIVSSEVATSLSLVVTELLQNAVEHAFVPGPQCPDAPFVRIELSHGAGDVSVTVVDNGVGLAPDFDPDRPQSLGQSIVGALVRDELGGSIEYRSSHGDASGTTVTVQVASHKRWE